MRFPVPLALRNRLLALVGGSRFNRLAGFLTTPSRWRRPPQEDIRTARTILVIKADEMGDVVLATGFLRALRRACPAARIVVAVRSMNTALIPCPSMADACFLWNDAWYSGAFSFRGWLGLIRSARRVFAGQPPDWALIPRGSPDHRHMALFAWWSGARKICAHEAFCIENGIDRKPLVSDIIPAGGPLHEADLHQLMLQSLGLREADCTPAIEIDEPTRASALRLLDSRSSHPPRIALGIGAGDPSRVWPESHFADLLRRLLPSTGTAGFIVIGSGDEAAAGERLAQLDPGRIVNAAGRLSLRETAAVLKCCALYAGNNSGPMHLAAAVGCAIVEISKHPLDGSDRSPDAPLRFGARTTPGRSLILRPGAGETIAHIRSEDVFGAVFRLLDERTPD